MKRGFFWTALVLAGCSIGEGSGSVSTEHLFIEDCWDREYDLKPTFFAANPYDDTLTIRIQRGEEPTLVSDGLSLLVHDTDTVRDSLLGIPLPLALPVGVAPIGFAAPDVPREGMANLTFYLNESCPNKNATLTAVGGTVTFEKLFSGDRNEDNPDDRVTIGSFSATVVEPRDAVARPNPAPGEPPYYYPEERQSEVEGSFRFVFHRGTPAQPFP